MAVERPIINEQRETHLWPFDKRIILLVNPNCLIPHEQLFDHKLAQINFSSGWHGPAIPVISNSDDLFHNYSFQTFTHFTPALYNTNLLIVDGHHRWHLAKKAGLSRVPVELFPYQSDEIVVGKHRDETRDLTKIDVLDVFNTRQIFPPESTKHEVRGTDGILRHISAYQQVIHYPSLGYGSYR